MADSETTLKSTTPIPAPGIGASTNANHEAATDATTTPAAGTPSIAETAEKDIAMPDAPGAANSVDQTHVRCAHHLSLPIYLPLYPNEQLPFPSRPHSLSPCLSFHLVSCQLAYIYTYTYILTYESIVVSDPQRDDHQRGQPRAARPHRHASAQHHSSRRHHHQWRGEQHVARGVAAPRSGLHHTNRGTKPRSPRPTVPELERHGSPAGGVEGPRERQVS